jgi:negative regulator of replication initiation
MDDQDIGNQASDFGRCMLNITSEGSTATRVERNNQPTL